MKPFAIAYLVVLVGCTLLAARVWYQARDARDPAQKQLLVRFVLGLGIFWLVALIGYFAGFFSFSE